MSLTATPADSDTGSDRVLREIEDRVLWLATAIVDQANRVRPNPGGLKVGGHQASSASMVTIILLTTCAGCCPATAPAPRTSAPSSPTSRTPTWPPRARRGLRLGARQ
ncbi:MAG TPA: hypothetical protein VE823_00655, partial [Geodermatophilus sp.]|nr:hypothetical protein [Geodermatophilus sp.]